MNPAFPLLFLIPLLIVVIIGGAWFSWKSTRGAPAILRKKLFALRTIGLVILAIILLNPGRWQNLQDETQKTWVHLIDDSRSMSVSSRALDAQALSEKITRHTDTAEIKSGQYFFSDTLTDTSSNHQGTGTDLSTAADALLSQMSAQGEALAGVIVLSDGRQTHHPRHSDFALRAQALGVPFYTVPIGGQHAMSDLEVTIPRKTITVFPQQNVQITVAIHSQNLPEFENELHLETATGESLASETIRLKADSQNFHTFSIAAPEQSTTWKIRLPQHPEEMRLTNNESEVHIRVLQNKARIFLAEGAPYWDSKFLAQLLRQQEYMEVHSVHRLSDTRWFHVNSAEATPHESDTNVFPNSLEELKSYDLVVFGKNSEHFLDDARAAHLRSFVKEQGGSVLFARAKPYSGRLPGLEPLEPVSWATGLNDQFQLLPSLDGQAAGLFGQALPGPDSQIWKSLPELKDAHRIDIVKPFTRILAHGQSPSEKFPLLMVRRYGQGVTGLVNADGLWKWDFYPDARELGNMYQEYWIQMIYWMLAYSEFLPGQNYSLNLSSQSVQLGTPVSLRMSYRGTETPAPPHLRVSSPRLPAPIELVPSEIPSEDGSLKWMTSFTPEHAGSYRFQLVQDGQTMPEANLSVLPPPTEMDELSADPEFLRRFAEATGGALVQPKDFDRFINETLKKETPEIRESGMKWVSSWMHWLLPLLLVTLFAFEWFLRRRNGLI